MIKSRLKLVFLLLFLLLNLGQGSLFARSNKHLLVQQGPFIAESLIVKGSSINITHQGKDWLYFNTKRTLVLNPKVLSQLCTINKQTEYTDLSFSPSLKMLLFKLSLTSQNDLIVRGADSC